jgi:hypothetical protein
VCEEGLQAPKRRKGVSCNEPIGGWMDARLDAFGQMLSRFSRTLSRAFISPPNPTCLKLCS